jgi:chromosome segregation ATPase
MPIGAVVSSSILGDYAPFEPKSITSARLMLDASIAELEEKLPELERKVDLAQRASQAATTRLTNERTRLAQVEQEIRRLSAARDQLIREDERRPE